jgi:hypothetical protein
MCKQDPKEVKEALKAQFAGMALQGLLSCPGDFPEEARDRGTTYAAELAVMYANALIHALSAEEGR